VWSINCVAVLLWAVRNLTTQELQTHLRPIATSVCMLRPANPLPAPSDQRRMSLRNICVTPGTRLVALATATLPRSLPRDRATYASPTLRQQFYPCGRPEEYHMQPATPAPAQPAPLTTDTIIGRLAAARAGTPDWVSVHSDSDQHLPCKTLNKIKAYTIYLLCFLSFEYPRPPVGAWRGADRMLLKIQTLEVDKTARFPEYCRMPTTCKTVRNRSPWVGIAGTLRPLLVLLSRCRCGPMTG
jgi:hypothetical protein